MDTTAQQQQLDAAVTAALSPTSTQELRAQAYTFLEQVRQSRLEAWPACLGLFLSGREDAATGQWQWTYDQQSRVFGLTILDEVLLQCFDKLSADNVQAIRRGILDYARREYVTGQAEQNNTYAKNKVARTIFCLFLNTYATTWQSFFADFASLVRAHPTGASTSTASTLNPKATDLFLRILHEIALEISDVQLRLNKEYGRLNKDTELRDLIRANAASGLSALIFEVLRDTLAVVDQPSAGPNSAAGRTDLVEFAVRAVGDYVSWIDINLVITPHTIPLIFQCLQAPQLNIRTAAVEACHETVAKGMPSADKLELIRVLNIREVLRSLLEAALSASDLEDDEEVAFRLRLARLLNTTGLELAKAAADIALDQQRKREAYTGATELLSMALRFLQDADLGICAAVQPFITAQLQDLKKQKKVARTPMTDDQANFLSELLSITVRRMEFPADADWNGVVDDAGTDDNTPFLELRQALRILFDAVAFIDDQLFANQVTPVVTAVLDALGAGNTASLTWQRVELVLHLLWLWGEADKSHGVGIQALVNVSKEDLDRAKRNRDFRIDYVTLPPSPLGALLKRLVTSPIASYPHPSVPLQFFECLIRYHDLFTLIPESIPSVLEAFCDKRGLHHPVTPVQQRCCYLFNRFVSTGKEQIQLHVSVDLTKSVLSALSDLLEIKVDLAGLDLSGDDPLYKAAHTPGTFESQLTIFEAVGTLINLLHQVPQEQSALLKMVVDRLVAEMRANVRPSAASKDDVAAILRVHHAIIAIGSVCRGFPNLASKHEVATGVWAPDIVEATGQIIEALRVMSSISIIREATISTFKVVVNSTGSAVLSLVPSLMDCVLDKLNAVETIDFLPFIGLLMHKYKSDFVPLLEAIVHGLFARVYHFLAQPTTGTDDKLQHSDIRRAFYGLITNIVNANQQDIFLSERNKPQLESFLKAVVYHSTGEANIGDKRAAFGAINRLINAWVAPSADAPPAAATGTTTNGTSKDPPPPTGRTLPGFETFAYDNVMPLCIESPISKEFDYSDGQSFLLIGEMTAALKTLYNRRGQEMLGRLDGQLKAMSYPVEQAQALLGAIQSTADWHDLKKFYAPFCQEMRKVRFNALDAAAAVSSA